MVKVPQIKDSYIESGHRLMTPLGYKNKENKTPPSQTRVPQIKPNLTWAPFTKL